MDGSRTLYWFDPLPMGENRTELGFQFGRVRVRYPNLISCFYYLVTSELTTSIRNRVATDLSNSDSRKRRRIRSSFRTASSQLPKTLYYI
ncbi:unnamed protein product, partial [Musa hybrid cultivar]